jgi:toxin FitB
MFLSELMRPSPNRRVVKWVDARCDSDLWISAVTVAEIRLGLSLLPHGARKNLLLDLAEQMFAEDFSERCLPFDCDGALQYSFITSERNRQGHPISVEDAQIAAIALTSGFVLATRNVKDFTGIKGLRVVNPWAESHSSAKSPNS